MTDNVFQFVFFQTEKVICSQQLEVELMSVGADFN